MDEGSRPRPVSRRALLFLALGLALGTCAVFARSVANGFVHFDDYATIVEAPRIRAGLTGAGVAAAFTRPHGDNWHPLTTLSHMLDAELFGVERAAPHHAESVLLHAATAALLFLFLGSATGRTGASLAAAALFALHPLRVESVAWASERKDVLSGLFWMLTLLAWARWTRRPSGGRYALALGLFALGLLAKPMLVGLPVVLLLLDVWPLGRTRLAPPARADGEALPPRPLRALVREKLPFFALALLAALATFLAQSRSGAVRSTELIPLAARLANAPLATLTYAAKTLWPTRLAFYYPHPALVAPEVSRALPALLATLALAAFTAAALWRVRARPWLAVGWLWFLVTLVPVIGLVQVGEQALADRYTYLPGVGLVVALAFGLAALARTRAARTLLGAGCALATLLLALATWRQIGTWRDTETLCRHALAATQQNYVAHVNLGNVHTRAGRPGAARLEYEQALAIVPDDPYANVNLGALLLGQGDARGARAPLERALRRQPGHRAASLLLGRAALAEEDWSAAAEAFERVLAGGDDAEARRALALCRAHLRGG